jgi:signal peptidase I
MNISKLTNGWFGYVLYAAVGILFAFFLTKGLSIVLNTSFPVVAVQSGSMVHDETVQTSYYGWLESNLNYNESYINSWPIGEGFNIGDLPIIAGSSNYNVGDIIVYSIPSEAIPIIHRIITINPDGTYITKGDHNDGLLSFERSVNKNQVYGRVIFVVPKLGYVKIISTDIWNSLSG